MTDNPFKINEEDFLRSFEEYKKKRQALQKCEAIKERSLKKHKPRGLGGGCRPNLDEDYNYKHYYDLDSDNNYVIR